MRQSSWGKSVDAAVHESNAAAAAAPKEYDDDETPVQQFDNAADVSREPAGSVSLEPAEVSPVEGCPCDQRRNPSLWLDRLVEVSLAAGSGILYVTHVLPTWMFIAVVAVAWTLWISFQLYRCGRAILKSWGLRWDQPNLRNSFVMPSIFTLVAIIAILIVSAAQGKPIGEPFKNWHFWASLVGYPVYGLLQHLMLQSMVTRNLSWFCTGSDDWTVWTKAKVNCNVTAILQLVGCILLSALPFGWLHNFDVWIMRGTAVLGVAWAFFYLQHGNLFPLGLYHGWLGAFYYYWFLWWDPFNGLQLPFDI